MANPPGENAGCSCAFSPVHWDHNGRSVDNTIMIADEMTEGIFLATFDLDELRSYRSKEMMGNTFRKVHAYKELLSDKVEEPFIRRVIKKINKRAIQRTLLIHLISGSCLWESSTEVID